LIPDVLTPIAAVVVAVVLEGDFQILPTHIDVRDHVTAVADDGYLRRRGRKPGVDNKQSQPGLHRRVRATVNER
jgi:hypothetical protein